MSSTQDSITIKNPDGSTLVVKVKDITDPALKKEIQTLENNKYLRVLGNIVKKKV